MPQPDIRADSLVQRQYPVVRVVNRLALDDSRYAFSQYVRRTVCNVWIFIPVPVIFIIRKKTKTRITSNNRRQYVL